LLGTQGLGHITNARGEGGEKYFFNNEIQIPDVQPISNKSKGKVHPLAGHEGPGESRGISLLFL